MSLLLLGFKPYFLASMPVLLVEGLHLGKVVVAELQKNPEMMAQIYAAMEQQMPAVLGRADWARMSSQARWNLVENAFAQLAATCEIWQGLFLLVELLLPTRSLLGTSIPIYNFLIEI